MPSRHDTPAPAECPVCGAAVPPRAVACPECGADERSGWNEDDTRYDGVDLPDSAFDDEPESTSRKHRARTGPSPFWLLVGAALLIAFIALTLGLF